MKLLSYYEQYTNCRRELSVLNGRMRILALEGREDTEERARLLDRMEEMEEKMNAICRTLEKHTGGESIREQHQLNDERLYLECRYLQGMTIEQTADAMSVSRDTAFRIRRRLAKKEISLDEGAEELPRPRPRRPARPADQNRPSPSA